MRAVSPDTWQWQLGEHLLADIADSLRWLVWSKTTAAQHNRNRPEPIPRPGVHAERERIGTATPLEEMNALLGWEV